MSELGILYIEDKDTKVKKEIKLFDSKYISIEDINLRTIIKKFYINIYFYLFKRTKIQEHQIKDSIFNFADNVYKSYNEYLEEQNIPPINYQEAFDKDLNTKPEYIM